MFDAAGRGGAQGPLPTFDVVLNAKTVRGLIVGARRDLQEARAFAGEGWVRTVYSLDNVNGILDSLRAGHVEGRVVMRVGAEA